ncbi:MAG: cache domain-containing protein [Magnetospirillum sp. WYHS-4]
MRNIARIAVLAACAVFGLSRAARAADECVAAQGLVDKAIAHYMAVGQEKSFANFMDKANKDWVSGELYVIVSTMDGIFKAHAINPKLIDNKDLPSLRDYNGVLIIQEMIKAGKSNPGGAWAKYTWTHPETKKLAPKQTWVKANGDLLFMAGCYPPV